MPNWCENNLSIYGKQEDMNKLMEVITIGEDTYSLLEKLYPVTDELSICDVLVNPDEQQIANFEKFGYKSWYDWSIAHWGTKWPESSLDIGQVFTENNRVSTCLYINKF